MSCLVSFLSQWCGRALLNRPRAPGHCLSVVSGKPGIGVPAGISSWFRGGGSGLYPRKLARDQMAHPQPCQASWVDGMVPDDRAQLRMACALGKEEKVGSVAVT